jgi:hypothetical protein
LGMGDVRWHDRGGPDPVARGPGTDAESVAAATFRVCRELLDRGAGAAELPLQAGFPPCLHRGQPPRSTPSAPGAAAGLPPKAALDISQRSR